MKYLILRDDDTNATTPPQYLERLYAPFLDRGQSVNLAIIPEVRTDAPIPGRNDFEPYLHGPQAGQRGCLPLSQNAELVKYIRARGYGIAQHGCHHDAVEGRREFAERHRADIVQRLERGAAQLMACGFSRPLAFVAPGVEASSIALWEIARRYRVYSGRRYQARHLPLAWIPGFLAQSRGRWTHWQTSDTAMLAGTPYYLGPRKHPERIVPRIAAAIATRQVTVISTHYWEYFMDEKPDEKLIAALHELSAMLAARSDVEMITFDQIAQNPTTILR